MRFVRDATRFGARHLRGRVIAIFGLLVGVSLVAGWQTVDEAARPATGRAVQDAASTVAAPSGRGITVTLSSPRRGVTVRGIVTLRAKARFAKGIARVVFAVDGRRIRVDRRAPFAARWDSRSVMNGRRRVRVTAFTKSGRSRSRLYVVTVANPRGLAPTPPPTPPPSVFLAPSGSDSGPCTNVVPCRTMDRAYGLANTAAGPVGVQMAGGTYPDQTIHPDASKATDNDVVFRPAAGASVIVSGEVRAVQVSHLTIAGIALEDWYLQNADDVTIQGVDTIAGYVNSSTRVRVLGGDYGPSNGATHSALLAIRGSSLGRTRDVLVDGVSFHDHTRAPGEHAEAMQIWSADDVTISNSKFKTCAVYCIFVANFDDPIPSRNVLIENNWFAPGSDTAGSQGAISYWAYGLTIRNNSFVGRGSGPNDPRGFPSQNVTITANLGFHGSCNNYAWNTYSYNVWDGRRCSPTDKNAPPGFVNAAGFDLHIGAGSAAIDNGNPASFPGVDIDGGARPLGSRPDAGADERS